MRTNLLSSVSEPNNSKPEAVRNPSPVMLQVRNGSTRERSEPALRLCVRCRHRFPKEEIHSHHVVYGKVDGKYVIRSLCDDCHRTITVLNQRAVEVKAFGSGAYMALTQDERLWLFFEVFMKNKSKLPEQLERRKQWVWQEARSAGAPHTHNKVIYE